MMSKKLRTVCRRSQQPGYNAKAAAKMDSQERKMSRVGSYSVIADTGEKLVEILRRGLVPELIADPHGIGLASPSERGDLSLGIWVYDIRESEEIRVSGMQSQGLDRQKYPPMYLTLYIMLTAYSSSDIKFRAEQEQRILGKAMQLFYDNSVMPVPAGIDMRIEKISPEIHEQREIWNASDVPYRTSLFYRVTPVELESEKSRHVRRVTSIDMTVEEKERDHV